MIDNTMALNNIAKVNRIKNYIEGKHKVLERKDFKYKVEEFKTAKIVLQSIKPIVQFHTSYICGNPVSLTGDKEVTAMLSSVYKKGHYNKVDYAIAKALYEYGNAYEYVYRDRGLIKSKVFDSADSYPIYENGEYVRFVEYWTDLQTSIEHKVVYSNDKVEVYENGEMVDEYNNTTGLPIHYKSGWIDNTGYFGTGLVTDLMPIMDEIEALLSKMSDSVTTLSMNPIGVSVADRVDSSVNSDVTGAVLNIESGGDFKWANATLDYNSIKLILDSLLNQFYTIASVPASLYGQSNIANVSEVSLKLLFNTTDNYAKMMSLELLEGMYKRLEYISKLMGVDVSSVDISFNYNRPVSNSEMVDDLEKLYGMGCISKESVIRVSPYTNDVDYEIQKCDDENDKQVS